MAHTSVAVIGVGSHPNEVDHRDGYSMGYRHADGYRSIDRCSIVGCADIVRKHAHAFTDHYGLGGERAFTDHREMLDALEPELVSVCTPPEAHLPIVVDCASHGSVRAVHCEKPIAPSWGESERLVETCEDHGVQLTFNFQYRFRPAVQRAKVLVDGGEIGSLRRVEIAREDLLQTGVHNIDVANYLNGDAGAKWVIGGLDYREETVWYTDMYSENQSVGLWSYGNGVHGIAFTGHGSGDVVDAQVRAIGTNGELAIRFWGESPVEVRRSGADGWTSVHLDETGDPQVDALADTIDALHDGRTPLLSADIAIRASEIVFGVWESTRRRGRVDLPLDVDDNPLESLVEGE